MNIKEAKQELMRTVKAYMDKDEQGRYRIPLLRQRPMLLMGPPGVGKTQIMEQIARECGIALVAYTITHHTRQSAVGLPFIEKEEYAGKIYSVTQYTMSEIIASIYQKMRETGLKEGILFIDEINCVSETLARKGRHGTLTFSMIYAYSERFILIFSHDEVVYGKGSMIMKMPGDKVQKFANLRVSYGYMTTHPGKKLLFMGQEFAQREEWNEKKALQWELLKEQEHKQMQRYVKELNMFYRNHPALYAMDSDPEGFQWLSCLDADHSIVTFMRKDGESGEQLLVLCNFTPVVYENFKLGVPFKGKFKEIFNSDARKYGGDGNENTRLRQSSEIECDGFDQSINVVVPPLGIAIFSCTKTESTSKKNTAKGRRQV